jgi:hypothetical protein
VLACLLPVTGITSLHSSSSTTTTTTSSSSSGHVRVYRSSIDRADVLCVLSMQWAAVHGVDTHLHIKLGCQRRVSWRQQLL